MPNASKSASAETRRLAALAKYEILDTAPEADFDNLARLAAMTCHAPIVTIGLVDGEREWFKTNIGLDVAELSLEESFGARAIGGSQVLVVPDTTRNSRFSQLSLVDDPVGIRFYAAAPLVTRTGVIIGVLSVMDRKPRQGFTIEQRTALQTLAAQVMAQLDLRYTVQELAIALCQKHAALAAANQLRLLLPMCSECKNVRSDDEYWMNVDEYLSAHKHLPHLTHGVCTECREENSSPVSLRPQPYPRLLGSRFGFFRR